jgi:sigma-E factor negative regulatory protein RseB
MGPELRHSLLFLLLLVCACAKADDGIEARQWLERMDMAMSQMTYQGTFVYVHGSSVETMRITHLAGDDGVRERLYSISGPRREIIRDEDGVRCLLGDEGSMMQDSVISPSYFPELPLNELDNFETYRFETGGSARIAGHTAVRVTILPADNYRYGYEFWLEKQTGLLLKWVLHDARNQILAKLMFTEVKLGAEVDLQELESPTPSEQFTPVKAMLPAHQMRTRAAPKWQPSRLPAGFRLEAYNRQQEESEGIFEHLVYSDGLAAVSVYIESRNPAEGRQQGGSRVGTANAFSRSMGDLQVTVIGEVPAETVRSIGNAVTLSASGR